MNQSDDDQHLQLLTIFHFVHAGITALFSCFPIFHFLIGVALIVAGLAQARSEPAALSLSGFGLVFAGISGSIMFLGWSLAFCIALTGFFLLRRKGYLFCLVIAGIQCAFTPLGTILGVFTIVVLVRPSVKAAFVPTAPQISQTV
jgi:hypothetical protein